MNEQAIHPAVMNPDGQPAQADILVTGDATIDWILAVPTVIAPTTLQKTYQYETRAAVQIVAQPGSAAMVHAVLAASATQFGGVLTVDGVTVPDAALVDPERDILPRTFAVWQPFPVQAHGRELTWRMQQFLGVRPAAGSAGTLIPRTNSARCLVIDDANLGFRDDPAAWPACLTGDCPPEQLVLKMSSPLGRGRLWDRMEAFGDRLTLYLWIGDLRKEFAPIGQPLSWERTATDVTLAIRERRDLAAAQRVIVTLGLSGALLIERDGPSRLIFDPLHQEGDWEHSRPGTASGLGTCVTAALALAALDTDRLDWTTAIQRGLEAGRALHEQRIVRPGSTSDDGLAFPAAMVTGILAGDDGAHSFRSVDVPDHEEWHIFASAFAEGHRALAARIVVEGEVAACQDVPVERIGYWSSIDRTEIESMRSVRNIIREYLQEQRGRPLSLAVFGPPGSGKSFAIKQMAREWMGDGTQLAVLEFNLSQFSAAEDLPVALQRVRDCAVEGTLPLVFWDEFDAAFGGRELGWLAQFLAPMQDGGFIEDGIFRPIGPAIFIFAGGTHGTMASFKARAVEIPSAKATDFLSRLRGYVDILGPNPRDANDRTFVLRRALLLRALVSQRAPGLLRRGRIEIDPGVQRAFLDVTTYVHGARSMESIVDMSTLSGRLLYERSALPPRHQLGLHVDPDEFLALVHAQDWHPTS